MAGLNQTTWLLLLWAAAGCIPAKLIGDHPLQPGTRATPIRKSSFIDDKIDFEKQVQPILVAHCYACHGPNKQESNYRLDVRRIAMSAADFGEPPIVAGKKSQSPLYAYISGQPDAEIVMPPPKSAALSREQVRIIGTWIDQGAEWPDRLAGNLDQRLTTDHWSFQEPTRPEVPVLNPPDRRQALNPIDNFVISSLLQRDLQPSAAADRVTWIRRVYLIMHGLLPTADQVSAFVNDQSELAFQKVIDEVLASPHYGERWARHWLDVVRYAESTGFEINRARAGTHYYRDYVIRALNDDKPYRDFIVEQLAGDAMGVNEATSFLVGGPADDVKSPDISLTLMQRQDELADMVNTTCTAFLGLTVSCARCHNHKFDPILQTDYYAVQAVFSGVQHGQRELLLPEDEPRLARRKWLEVEIGKIEDGLDRLRAQHPPTTRTSQPDPRLPAVNPRINEDSFNPQKARYVRFTIFRTNAAEPCLDELEIYATDSRENLALKATPGSSGDFANHPLHKLKHINDGKYGNPKSWISDRVSGGWVQLELAQPANIHRVVWGRDRTGRYSDRLAIDYQIQTSLDGKSWTEVSSGKRRAAFAGTGKEPEDAFISRLPGDRVPEIRKQFSQLVELRKELGELTRSARTAYIGNFRNPGRTHRLHRGDPLSPREEVGPDALAVIGSLGLDQDAPDQQRRLAFARWIASAENPLTARVIVNRVWHYHFGRGIVATPSDFGMNGIPPTHPELLDWLATEFVHHDWSLKWLHRQILSSATFRQSSRPRPQPLAIDADNHFLWRFPPRRLEAEAIRDCILQVSGMLNPEAGGPGFVLFKVDGSETVHHYFPLEEFQKQHFRRMIYMTKIRQEQDEVFGVFDCPDGGQVIPNRSRSTTPLQALNLLNSKFMVEQADHLARRIADQAGADLDRQVEFTFRTMLLREPSREEAELARKLILNHGLAAFCRAMLNANEFLFVS